MLKSICVEKEFCALFLTTPCLLFVCFLRKKNEEENSPLVLLLNFFTEVATLHTCTCVNLHTPFWQLEHTKYLVDHT